MCGFSGIILKENNSKDYIDILSKSINLLQHRGPDHTGLYYNNGIYLGHKRLTIIDTNDSSNQPFFDNTKKWAIVFNGEIYNYKDLYNKYLTDNQHVNKNSDTSVLLFLYIKFGVKCISLLNGMFAFVIVNLETRKFVLVRDRFGEKPLYWTENQDYFAFSSELKALSILPKNTKNTIKSESLLDYTLNGCISAPNTIFKDIQQLEAAHYIVVKNNNIIENKHYWDLMAETQKYKDIFNHKYNQNEIYNLTNEYLNYAVSSRLVSDVEVGYFLSGGIDSASIVSLASKTYHYPKKAITIDFNDVSLSEYKIAKITAQKFNIDLKRYIIEKDYFNRNIDSFFKYMDQPTVDGFNTFFLSIFAKEQNIKVWLSGVGGDELFCGYRSFQHLTKREKLRKSLKNILPDIVLMCLFKNFGTTNLKLSKLIHLFMGSENDSLEAYNSLRRVIPILNANKLIKEDLSNLAKPDKSIRNINNIEFTNNLQKVSFLESGIYMKDLLLRDIDNFSMSSSIEVRAPFLEHNLWEFVMAIPADIRYKKSEKKTLLINSLNTNLPIEVINQPKKGFGFPLHTWLREDLELKDVILDTNFKDIWDLKYIENLYILFEKKKINWDVLWPIYSFNKWYLNNI